MKQYDVDAPEEYLINIVCDGCGEYFSDFPSAVFDRQIRDSPDLCLWCDPESRDSRYTLTSVGRERLDAGVPLSSIPYLKEWFLSGGKMWVRVIALMMALLWLVWLAIALAS